MFPRTQSLACFRQLSKKLFSPPQLSSLTQTIPSIYKPNHCYFSSSKVTYSLEQVKELRTQSGAPLKECKKALSATNGNIEESLDWLRIQGVNVARMKAGDTAANGFISSLVSADNRIGSLIEVNSVTDFVEKNELFQNSVYNIAQTIVYSNQRFANIGDESNTLLDISALNDANIVDSDGNNSEQTVSEAITDIVAVIRENLVFRRAARIEVSASGVVSNYLHSRTTPNLAMKGALVGLESSVELDSDGKSILSQLGNNISTHLVVNSCRAKCVNKTDISEQDIEHEKEILLKQALDESGDSEDERVVMRKVEGRLKKYYMDVALMEQPYCLDDDNKFTIAKLIAQTGKELGCDISVSDFAVFHLGEQA